LRIDLRKKLKPPVGHQTLGGKEGNSCERERTLGKRFIMGEESKRGETSSVFVGSVLQKFVCRGGLASGKGLKGLQTEQAMCIQDLKERMVALVKW